MSTAAETNMSVPSDESTEGDGVSVAGLIKTCSELLGYPAAAAKLLPAWNNAQNLLEEAQTLAADVQAVDRIREVLGDAATEVSKDMVHAQARESAGTIKAAVCDAADWALGADGPRDAEQLSALRDQLEVLQDRLGDEAARVQRADKLLTKYSYLQVTELVMVAAQLYKTQHEWAAGADDLRELQGKLARIRKVYLDPIMAHVENNDRPTFEHVENCRRELKEAEALAKKGRSRAGREVVTNVLNGASTAMTAMSIGGSVRAVGHLASKGWAAFQTGLGLLTGLASGASFVAAVFHGIHYWQFDSVLRQLRAINAKLDKHVPDVERLQRDPTFLLPPPGLEEWAAKHDVTDLVPKLAAAKLKEKFLRKALRDDAARFAAICKEMELTTTETFRLECALEE